MCAILDANVAHQVFGENRPDAGKEFFNWLSRRKGKLVVGGKLLGELSRNDGFREWLNQALQSGRARVIPKDQVESHNEDLLRKETCESDDSHIIALARESGARLLYSNDKMLHKDFKKKELIDNPRGLIYTTLQSGDFSKTHRSLLSRGRICQD